MESEDWYKDVISDTVIKIEDGAVRVIEKSVDPIAIRVSAGIGKTIKGETVYITYRGNLEDVERCLEMTLEAIRRCTN